jgi:hypothetical protein
MTHGESDDEGRLEQPQKATNPISAHLGARPSRWALVFFWVSVAAAGFALVLLAATPGPG